jgi:Na+/melibiose symporter-like transporter
MYHPYSHHTRPLIVWATLPRSMWRPRSEWLSAVPARFRGLAGFRPTSDLGLAGARYVSRLSLAYGAGSFAASALHSVFITYYVAVFVGVHTAAPEKSSPSTTSLSVPDAEDPFAAAGGLVGGGSGSDSSETSIVPAQWFLGGEAVFALWNAINDPLFGYFLSRGGNDGRLDLRMRAIQWGGILWGLAFVLAFCVTPRWLAVQLGASEPLSGTTGHAGPPDWLVGMHFVASLFCYDGGLSLVMLAHGSVLADIALSTAERANCNAVNSFMGAVGSCVVFVAHSLWGMEAGAVHRFRVFCAVIAVGSAGVFWWSAQVLWEDSERLRRRSGRDSTATSNDEVLPVGIREFAREVWKVRNFRAFAAFNFLQVFNCHFNSNFLPLFLLHLVGTTLPRSVHSTVVTLSSIIPHLAVVYVARLIPERGLWWLVNRLVMLKQALPLVFGATLWLLSDLWKGTESSVAFWPALGIALYLVLNKSASEVICRHGNLVLADVTDEFAVNIFSRSVDEHPEQRSWSAAVLGANAFLTKPAASIAPMVGWWLLQNDRQGIHAIATWVFAVPLIVGAVQALLWRRYSLRGDRLVELRRWRKTMDDAAFPAPPHVEDVEEGW